VGRQVVSLVALAKNKLFLNSSHRSTHFMFSVGLFVCLPVCLPV